MTKKWRKETRLEDSPELVFDVICDGEFQVASAKLDEGCVDATFEEVSRTADRLVMEIRSKEYSRGMTGIDKSKIESSKTKWNFDLKRRRGSWEYLSESSWASKVTVVGTDSVEDAGGKARLISEAEFSVKIPLIGGKIEGLIMKDVEKARPKFEALVREFCQKKS